MKKLFLSVAVVLVFTSLSFAKDLIVGVQAPITGSMASEGQGMQRAVELLAEQANAAGGINGDTIKVIVCDDEGTTGKAAICAKNLVDQGAKVVIGSYTSSATEASQAYYSRFNVIQTSDATAASLTKKNYPTYFRASFNDDIEGEFTANYFIAVRNYKRVAIISDYGTFSDGLAKAVREHLQKLGGKDIVVSWEKINAGAQDYKAVLTKIKERNPDVVYFSGYYTESALLRAQAVQLGLTADYYGGNATDNADFVKIAGVKAAAGSYLIGLPTPDQLDYPEAKQFAQDYLNKYKEKIPSIWVVVNADGLRVVFEAMRQTKTNDTVTAAKYIRGSIKDFNGFTGPITIQSNGERAGSIYQVNIINSKGEYEVWKPE